MEKKDDLLDVTISDSYEIDLGYLTASKAAELWAIILKKLYHLIGFMHLKVSILV